jgi:hypothetical protein
VIIVMLDAILGWLEDRTSLSPIWSGLIGAAVCALMVGPVVIYPRFADQFPVTGYRQGIAPELYAYFAKQPKNSLIATTAAEGNNLPSYARRSILTGRQYAIPYHMGYYNQIRRRTEDLIRAQYSADADEVKSFIREYGITHFLIERDALTPKYLESNRWIRQFQPIVKDALEALERGSVPFLLKTIPDCSVFETDYFIVLDARRILEYGE